MFDDFQKIQELKKMQEAFKAERETVQKRGISVTVNGNMQVESITLNPALNQGETEVILKECINDAQKNVQKRLAKAMTGSGFGGL
jgi:DNA-binding protein YbaB